MTRRDWLTRVFGATVAAAVAPLVDLTDTTPAFWRQAPLRDLMRWRIDYPDGTAHTFSATVVSERVLSDGSVELAVRPEGPIEATVWSGGPSAATFEPIALGETREPATVLGRDGASIGELVGIELPQLVREAEGRDIDGAGLDYLAGLQQRGPVTFTVDFSPVPRA